MHVQLMYTQLTQIRSVLLSHSLWVEGHSENERGSKREDTCNMNYHCVCVCVGGCGGGVGKTIIYCALQVLIYPMKYYVLTIVYHTCTLSALMVMSYDVTVLQV